MYLPISQIYLLSLPDEGAACGLVGGALQAGENGNCCRLPSPAALWPDLAGEVPADQQEHGAAQSGDHPNPSSLLPRLFFL